MSTSCEKTEGAEHQDKTHAWELRAYCSDSPETLNTGKFLWQDLLGGWNEVQSPDKFRGGQEQLYCGLCLMYRCHHLQLVGERERECTKHFQKTVKNGREYRLLRKEMQMINFHYPLKNERCSKLSTSVTAIIILFILLCICWFIQSQS